jgi:hypothetical protein
MERLRASTGADLMVSGLPCQKEKPLKYADFSGFPMILQKK